MPLAAGKLHLQQHSLSEAYLLTPVQAFGPKVRSCWACFRALERHLPPAAPPLSLLLLPPYTPAAGLLTKCAVCTSWLQLGPRLGLPADAPLLRMPALAGWPYCDLYNVWGPDDLHNNQKGVAEVLLKKANDHSVLSLLLADVPTTFPSTKRAAAALGRVNDELLGLKFMGSHVPRDGIAGTKSTGSEFAFLTRCALVALLAAPVLVDLLLSVRGERCCRRMDCMAIRGLSVLPALSAEYLEWEKYVLRDIHTPSSLEAMKIARITCESLPRRMIHMMPGFEI